MNLVESVLCVVGYGHVVDRSHGEFSQSYRALCVACVYHAVRITLVRITHRRKRFVVK